MTNRPTRPLATYFGATANGSLQFLFHYFSTTFSGAQLVLRLATTIVTIATVTTMIVAGSLTVAIAAIAATAAKAAIAALPLLGQFR